MIVESMTHEEVYQELARDRDSVTTWWRHQLDTLRRTCLKSTMFPRCFWREYISTRKNRYLFFTRIFDKRMKMILTGIAAIRRARNGMTVYTTWLSDQRLIAPMVLLPHVWKRYAERTGTQKTGIDLRKHYFTSNTYGTDSHDQMAVGRKVRYMDVEHLSCCVNDGVLLGQQEGLLFIAHTFITYDMTCGRQQQEFDSKRGEILTDRKLYEEARRYYLG